MRLVTFTASGAQRVGAIVDNDRRIVDFAAAGAGADPAFASMQALIEGGAPALDRARAIVAVAQRSGRGMVDTAAVRLLAPLPVPAQMRDFLCFEKHLIQAFARLRQVRAATTADPEKALREMEAAGTYNVPKIWYERPSFYKPSRFAVCGTDQDVVWPAYSKTIDYELEFACVIGKAGRNIPKDQARDYIFGYTIFNDLSARDEQSQEMLSSLGPGKGKDFDNSNPIGPCIVTADEIPDPYALDMIVRVNWRGTRPRQFARNGLEIRGLHRLRDPRRDRPSGRSVLLRHGRQRLGPRNRPLCGAGRSHRARSRKDRRTAQSHRTC